jgi:hypothetical protein
MLSIACPNDSDRDRDRELSEDIFTSLLLREPCRIAKLSLRASSSSM